MGAKSFKTVQALSDRQSERELQEALRVHGMTPTQRWQWLQEEWGRLQKSAVLLSPNHQRAPGTARCYATMDEKNRFDEARELRHAMQMPIHGVQQA